MERTRSEIRSVVRKVAERFGRPASDTILLENFGKHVEELALILMRLPGGGTVVDVGGGLGVNLLCLSELRPDARLVLVDRFTEYTEQNRMGPSAVGLSLMERAGIEIHEADIWAKPELPVADSSVAVATLLDVVEHLPGHPLRQLRAIRTALAPGGWCVLAAPNASSLMKRLHLLRGRHPYIDFEAWVAEDYAGHIREYSRAEYAELLRRAGFQVGLVRCSCAVPLTRAGNRYHRRRHAAASPVTLALWVEAALEWAMPPLRHSVQALGRKPEEGAGRFEAPGGTTVQARGPDGAPGGKPARNAGSDSAREV